MLIRDARQPCPGTCSTWPLPFDGKLRQRRCQLGHARWDEGLAHATRRDEPATRGRPGAVSLGPLHPWRSGGPEHVLVSGRKVCRFSLQQLVAAQSRRGKRFGEPGEGARKLL